MLFLARTLGRTVQELGETLTAEEFAMWQAEYQREPWGEFRIDLAGGVMASTLANVHRGKDTQPFTPVQFMPFSKPAVDEAIATDSASFLAYVKAMGHA